MLLKTRSTRSPTSWPPALTQPAQGRPHAQRSSPQPCPTALQARNQPIRPPLRSTSPTTLPNGASGTQPPDTAPAAINIAHNPALNVAALYALVTPTPPFQPTLASAPDNFTVALFVSSGGPSLPWGIAVDAEGNIWTANSFTQNVSKFSSLGVVLSQSTKSAIPAPVRIAIDSSGNAWVVSSGVDGYGVFRLSPSATALSGDDVFIGGGLNTPTAIAIDGADNVWVTNSSALGYFGSGSLASSVTEF